MNSIPWSVLDTFDDPNDSLDVWYKLFMDVVDPHAPLTERRVKHRKKPEWLTEDIKQAMKSRDTFKHIRDMEQYKIWQNNVITMIQESKSTYYQNIINANEKEVSGNTCLNLYQQVHEEVQLR